MYASNLHAFLLFHVLSLEAQWNIWGNILRSGQTEPALHSVQCFVVRQTHVHQVITHKTSKTNRALVFFIMFVLRQKQHVRFFHVTDMNLFNSQDCTVIL